MNKDIIKTENGFYKIERKTSFIDFCRGLDVRDSFYTYILFTQIYIKLMI